MTFKKSYVPGILGSVLTLTVIMAAPVKAETKEETILNKTDWSTMAAANVEGYVNIRSEANADSEIVGVLMPGYAVTVTEKGDEWSKISSNGVEGYIKNEYLVFGEEAKAHYRNMCGITGVVQADSLRVREAASTDSAQVGTLTQNGEVSIFGEEADWYQIQYSGSSAYVHGDYVTLSEELKGAVSMEEYQASQACAASSAAAASTAGSASVISADSNDVAMLAALIECEAGGESYTVSTAVPSRTAFPALFIRVDSLHRLRPELSRVCSHAEREVTVTQLHRLHLQVRARLADACISTAATAAEFRSDISIFIKNRRGTFARG